MGCGSSRGAVKEISSSKSIFRKKPSFFNSIRTVNVEKRPDSGRGSSANTKSTSATSGLRQDLIFSKPPYHIPKMESANLREGQIEQNGHRQSISHIHAAPRGIAYELKIDWDENQFDDNSIVTTHPPKSLKRLETTTGQMNFEKLTQDLRGADERKMKFIHERKENCQSRRGLRNGPTNTRRTSLESKEQARMIVTNVEIVHNDF